MRPIALALAATLILAGCGGDEPEEAPATTRQPAPTRPMADTTLGDTTAPAGAAAGQQQAGQRATGGADAGTPGQRAQQEPAPGRTAAGGAGGAGGAAGGEAAGGERVYTVQVAAFTESGVADEWAGRLRSQGLPVWTSMAEIGGQTFYRVRVGATPRFSEARQLGQMLTGRYEWPVWVAPLSPADQLPENAVRDTRSVLQGG